MTNVVRGEYADIWSEREHTDTQHSEMLNPSGHFKGTFSNLYLNVPDPSVADIRKLKNLYQLNWRIILYIQNMYLKSTFAAKWLSNTVCVITVYV